MGYSGRSLVLSALLLFTALAHGQSLKPGDKVPDFVMPAHKGLAQSLSQAVGHPVMLVWLGDCYDCPESIVRYQILAESQEIEGLRGWFIWSSDKPDIKPPRMRLPMLMFSEDLNNAWRFEETPAVMLINPDGYLDHLILGDLAENYQEVETTLMRWLSETRDGYLVE